MDQSDKFAASSWTARQAAYPYYFSGNPYEKSHPHHSGLPQTQSRQTKATCHK